MTTSLCVDHEVLRQWIGNNSSCQCYDRADVDWCVRWQQHPVIMIMYIYIQMTEMWWSAVTEWQVNAHSRPLSGGMYESEKTYMPSPSTLDEERTPLHYVHIFTWVKLECMLNMPYLIHHFHQALSGFSWPFQAVLHMINTSCPTIERCQPGTDCFCQKKARYPCWIFKCVKESP